MKINQSISQKSSNQYETPEKKHRIKHILIVISGILLSLFLIGIAVFNEQIEHFIKSDILHQESLKQNIATNNSQKTEEESTNESAQENQSSEDDEESEDADAEGTEVNTDQNEEAEEDQEENEVDDCPVTTNPSGYPDEILECTKDGNDLLVLVNKKYKLPSSYAPTDLVSVNNSGIRTTKTGLQVREIIIQDLEDLNNASSEEGIDVAVLSAYRSYSTQQSTYNYWVSTLGKTQADRVSARPGHSQHQLGTAVDFTSSEIGDRLGTEFAGTEAEKWLAQNAWKYGFVLAYPEGYEDVTGYSYEPWHYRYIGKENATEWKSSGEILEVWLRGE